MHFRGIQKLSKRKATPIANHGIERKLDGEDATAASVENLSQTEAIIVECWEGAC